MRIRCDWCQRIGDYEAESQLEGLLHNLKARVQGVAVNLAGTCWCDASDPLKPLPQHTGPCRELKIALKRIEEFL